MRIQADSTIETASEIFGFDASQASISAKHLSHFEQGDLVIYFDRMKKMRATVETIEAHFSHLKLDCSIKPGSRHKIENYTSTWLQNCLDSDSHLTNEFLDIIKNKIDALILEKCASFPIIGNLIDRALDHLRSGNKIDSPIIEKLIWIVVRGTVFLNSKIRISHDTAPDLARQIFNANRAIEVLRLYGRFDKGGGLELPEIVEEISLLQASILDRNQGLSIEDIIELHSKDDMSHTVNELSGAARILAVYCVTTSAALSSEQINKRRELSKNLNIVALHFANQLTKDIDYRIRLLQLGIVQIDKLFLDALASYTKVEVSINEINSYSWQLLEEINRIRADLKDEKDSYKAIYSGLCVAECEISYLIGKKNLDSLQIVLACTQTILQRITSTPCWYSYSSKPFQHILFLASKLDSVGQGQILSQIRYATRHAHDKAHESRFLVCENNISNLDYSSTVVEYDAAQILAKIKTRPNDISLFSTFLRQAGDGSLGDLTSGVLTFPKDSLARVITDTIDLERSVASPQNSLMSTIDLLSEPFDFRSRIVIESLSIYFLSRAKATSEPRYLEWAKELLLFGIHNWDDVFWYTRLSAVARLLENYGDACKYADIAIEKSPGDSYAVLQAALARFQPNRHTEAQSLLETFIQKSNQTSNIPILAVLAFSFSAQGLFRESEEVLKNIIYRVPTDQKALIHLSKVRFQRGWENITEVLEPALRAFQINLDRAESASYEADKDITLWISECLSSSSKHGLFPEMFRLVSEALPSSGVEAIHFRVS